MMNKTLWPGKFNTTCFPSKSRRIPNLKLQRSHNSKFEGPNQLEVQNLKVQNHDLQIPILKGTDHSQIQFQRPKTNRPITNSNLKGPKHLELQNLMVQTITTSNWKGTDCAFFGGQATQIRIQKGHKTLGQDPSPFNQDNPGLQVTTNSATLSPDPRVTN